MYHFRKHFTLEEARALLPWARERMRRLHEGLRELERLGFHVFGVEPIELRPDEIRFSRNGDGSHSFPRVYLNVLHLFRELDTAGVQIKSWIEGLIDFPALAPWGEEVLLCYLEGEEDIEYWHSLEGGYRGRRPVEGVFPATGPSRGSASA